MKPKRPPVPRATPLWLAPAALALLVLIAYANSFAAGFAFDSRGLILDDPRVHSTTNLADIWRHTYWWPVGESGLYRPFTTVSYLFNYIVLGNGSSAIGYHTVNVLLHTLNVVLVWMLARRWWSDRWAPLLIAAVWAVHPVLTESVTNVAGRADLLAGTSLLAGVLFYLKSKDDRRWLFALAAVTLLGVFSKESAVMIAAIIVAYEVFCGTDDRFLSSVRGLVAVLPPILFMLYQRSIVLSSSAPTEFPFTDNPLVAADFWTARLTALNILGRYIALLLWPAQLSCDYSYAEVPVSPVVWAWLPVAAALGFVIWRRTRLTLFLAASALLVLLPSSNLIMPIGSIMAERFLYLPAIAFAAAVVWVVYKYVPQRAMTVLGSLIAIYAVRTIARNTDWQDDLTLSAATVRTGPASFKSHKMRANALLESDPTHSNLDQVIAEADKSIAILDSLPPDRNNFDTWQRTAEYHVMKGDSARALQLYQRALIMTHNPPADIYVQMAKLHLRLGEKPAALDAARRARDLDPANPLTHRTLAGILLDADREEEAVVALVTGEFITHNDSIRQDLARLYQAGVAPDAHRNLCAAAPEIVRLRPDLKSKISCQ
jgi:tetratricopeptide (TPR) repeat protein